MVSFDPTLGVSSYVQGWMDKSQGKTCQLLYGDERKVWGDGSYQEQGEVIREAAPHAQDMTSRLDEIQELCG